MTAIIHDATVVPAEYWKTNYTSSCSMDGISILIPVYRDNCLKQVESLVAQCRRMAEHGLKWEILVVDDGSPVDESMVNSPIGRMENCSFIKRNNNYGRSSTRNFLVRLAHYDTLIFQDSGLQPSDNIVETYIHYAGKAQVVCGTVEVAPEAMSRSSLRAVYESAYSRHATPKKLNRHPYQSFRSCNFMALRQVMLDHPFSEDVKKYGYEDVLFGKQLKESGVGVLHIDNAVKYVNLEANSQYMLKVDEAITTLYNYRSEVSGYSRLLSLVELLQRHHLLGLVNLCGKLANHAIRKQLEGNCPSLLLFNVYRGFTLAAKYRDK